MTLDNGRVVAVHPPAVWRRISGHGFDLPRHHHRSGGPVEIGIRRQRRHELRTPLTSIKGYVDLMLKGAAGSFNESRSFLADRSENTERLTYLSTTSGYL